MGFLYMMLSLTCFGSIGLLVKFANLRQMQAHRRLCPGRTAGAVLFSRRLCHVVSRRGLSRAGRGATRSRCHSG